MKRKVRKTLEFEINPELIGEGITQSEMQTWDNCPSKWYYQYNLLLQKKGAFSWALTYGSWIHAALEEFYKTKGKRWSVDPSLPNKFSLPAETIAAYEYWSALAQLQMEVYTSHFKHDFELWKPKEVEFVVDLEFEGIRLKGMIDLFVKSLVHGGYYVVDHKTASRIDKQTVLGWDFRFQFMFYCWLAWKMWGDEMPIKGYFINGIKKPQLRQGKSEPIKALLQRVQTDMLQNPEKYFYRDRLVLKKGDLKHFEKHILMPKIARVRMLMDPKIPDHVKIPLLLNKNTDHCTHYGQPCPFMAICKNGIELEGFNFTIREVKHQELAGDGEE